MANIRKDFDKTKPQRVNYLKQINGFWYKIAKEEHQLRANHISLYLFLLNKNNLLNWEKWFQCPRQTILTGSKIMHKGTYYRVLKDLSDWGYIKFAKGRGIGEMAKFHIPLLYDIDTAPGSKLNQVDATPGSKLNPYPVQNCTGTRFNNEPIIKPFYKTLYKQEIDFSIFWNSYDNKKDEAASRKAWDNLTHEQQESALACIPIFKTHFSLGFLPYPANYLSGRRWEDEGFQKPKINGQMRSKKLKRI